MQNVFGLSCPARASQNSGRCTAMPVPGMTGSCRIINKGARKTSACFMCIFLILIIQTVCTAEVSIDTVDASQLNGNAPAIITVNEVEGASPARGSQILDTQSVSGRNGNILKPKIVVALTQSEIFNLKMKLALGSGIQIIGLGMNVGGTIMAFSDHLIHSLH
jgi:hypothetical protein